MVRDQAFRAFLLKMADAETEAAVEEAILDGSLDPTHLQQIEDELIDDSLFGRLTEQEARHFESDFLCTAELRERLKFATSLKRYSEQNPLPGPRRAAGLLTRFSSLSWRYSLAAALACLLLVAGWLVERNLNSRRELAQAARENNERQRLAGESQQQRKQQEIPPSPPDRRSVQEPPVPGATADQIATAMIHLSPVTRDLTPVPVLHLGNQTRTVSLVLRLPFEPHGTMHQELIGPDDKSVWSRDLPTAPRGLIEIKLPAALFQSDDYRLQVDAAAGDGEPPTRLTYVFRIRRH